MIKRNYYIEFIILFFVIISAPLIRMSTRILKDKSQREYFCYITSFHSIDVFNTYLLDNFGFRGSLTNLYMKIYLTLFAESPIPSKVVLSKNDWFFLGDEYNFSYSSAIGVFHFPNDTLNKTIDNILKIKTYCDSIDTQFYLVIAPDKNGIYSEYLRERSKPTDSFRELLIKSLTNKELNVLDLYTYIKMEKEKDSNRLLYYKTDSHWNQYGGYLASKYITDQINAQVDISPLRSKYITISKTKLAKGGGDLTNMLNLNIDDIDFNVVDNRNIELIERIEYDTQLSDREILFVKNNTISNKSKALIFKDSFFTAMKIPFLSTIKEAIVFHQYQFDTKVVNKMVEQEGKPDFILFEVVERNLKEIEYK